MESRLPHPRLREMTDRELLLLVSENMETVVSSLKDHEARIRLQENKTIKREANEETAEKTYSRNIGIGLIVATILGGVGDRVAHFVGMLWSGKP